MTTTTEGAPAPEIPEDFGAHIPRDMLEKAAGALLERCVDEDVMHEIAREVLEAAGVPALLARVKELEDALAFYSDAQNYQPDRDATHWVVPVYQDLGHRAHAVLAKKDAP